MTEETRDEQLFRKLMMAARKTRRELWKGSGMFEPEGPMPFMGHGPAMRPEGMEGHPGMQDCRGMGMRGHRPPLSRERILSVMAEATEGIHQKEICEKLHINPSSVSEFIDHLEDDGYVERKPDPQDKRATLLYLTDKGRARAAEAEDERSQGMKELFACLSEQEKDSLNQILDKLLAGAACGEQEL